MFYSIFHGSEATPRHHTLNNGYTTSFRGENGPFSFLKGMFGGSSLGFQKTSVNCQKPAANPSQGLQFTDGLAKAVPSGKGLLGKAGEIFSSSEETDGFSMFILYVLRCFERDSACFQHV